MSERAAGSPRGARRTGDAGPATTAEQLDAIVAAAAAASYAWAARSPHVRASALGAVAEALDAAADELVALADAETALGPTRLRGEVARTSAQLRMFAAAVIEGSYVEAVITPADPANGRPDVRRMLGPVGPVAVFSAVNFPFAFSVAGGDTASALAAGCPVIVKAHEGHPRTSARTSEIITGALRASGAPNGTFATVFGVPAGRRLVEHPTIRAVGFTGSRTGGRALFDLACARPDPIPFYGELGSVNPVLVLPGAGRSRPQEIARGYVASLTLGVGQFCTNPGLLFAPADPALLAAITEQVTASTGATMLNERIHTGYAAATAEPGWSRLQLLARGAADGSLAGVPEVRRVLLGEFARDVDRLCDERFGPAGLVVAYESLDDLAPVLGTLPGSLTASIHADADDLDRVGPLAAQLARVAGRLIMNGWPTGVAVCWAMHHGGPWPASTSAAHTSVGLTAMRRWLIPLAYQDWPDALLPPALQDANPSGVTRLVQP